MIRPADDRLLRMIGAGMAGPGAAGLGAGVEVGAGAGVEVGAGAAGLGAGAELGAGAAGSGVGAELGAGAAGPGAESEVGAGTTALALGLVLGLGLGSVGAGHPPEARSLYPAGKGVDATDSGGVRRVAAAVGIPGVPGDLDVPAGPAVPDDLVTLGRRGAVGVASPGEAVTPSVPRLPDPFAPVASTLRGLHEERRPTRILRLWRPWKIVAFSRRDERNVRFAAAAATARQNGFQAAVRPVGGTFAPLHPGSLIVDEFGFTVGEQWPTERFERHAALLAAVFRSYGIDARVGEVPGEYCPGSHSINRAGTAKLSGTAQRVSRGAWLVSSVVQVRDAAPLRVVAAAVAAALCADIDVARIGTLEESVPDLDADDLAARIIASFVDSGVERVEWGG